MKQGSALSSILSVLYIVLLLHLFEQWTQALNLDTSILSCIDDSLLASQKTMYDKTLLELSHVPIAERSNSELVLLCALEKWKISDLLCSMIKPKEPIKSVITL